MSRGVDRVKERKVDRKSHQGIVEIASHLMVWCCADQTCQKCHGTGARLPQSSERSSKVQNLTRSSDKRPLDRKSHLELTRSAGHLMVWCCDDQSCQQCHGTGARDPQNGGGLSILL